jgi:hypothetical protein
VRLGCSRGMNPFTAMSTDPRLMWRAAKSGFPSSLNGLDSFTVSPCASAFSRRDACPQTRSDVRTTIVIQERARSS